MIAIPFAQNKTVSQLNLEKESANETMQVRIEISRDVMREISRQVIREINRNVARKINEKY